MKPKEPFDAPTAPTLRCPSCGAPVPEADRSCAHCGSLLATRRCAACFTLNPREALKCTRCGADLPREELSASAAGKPCPDCRVPLVGRRTGVVGYAECARCGGLFLGREAFEKVTHEAEARATARAVEGERPPEVEKIPVRFHYRKCPACGDLMNRTNYSGGSGIILDVCGKDGVFLDRGELTGIVDFLEKGGWERLKKRERERLREEVAALEARKHASSLPDASFPDGGGTLGSFVRGAGWVTDLPDLVDLVRWIGTILSKPFR
ncbi:MAG TPA: zf-TFIIB domain-containing protein [Thermoanaerobaculia bacterium]|nr:zf-TFIIB domain-containing protein [Thermoanaerobaculia bacterium]